MVTSGTVPSAGSGRRVVRRRRPTLDEAYDVALSELPAELRQPMITYVAAKRAEFGARQTLSTLMPRHGCRWLEIDAIARDLTYACA
jgi:hypothetical protein